jgi:hypothetical protein
MVSSAKCEFAVLVNLAVHADSAAVLLYHDVVSDGQAKACALDRWFGAEERLEQLVPDIGLYTDAVIAYSDR